MSLYKSLLNKLFGHSLKKETPEIFLRASSYVPGARIENAGNESDGEMADDLIDGIIEKTELHGIPHFVEEMKYLKGLVPRISKCGLVGVDPTEYVMWVKCSDGQTRVYIFRDPVNDLNKMDCGYKKGDNVRLPKSAKSELSD